MALTKNKYILCSNCKYYVSYRAYDELRLSKDILTLLKLTVVEDNDPTYNSYECNDCITTVRFLSQNTALLDKYNKCQEELNESRETVTKMVVQNKLLATNFHKCSDSLVKLRKEISATNEVSSNFSELNKGVKCINETPLKLNTEITSKDYETIDVYVQQKINENSVDLEKELRDQNARRNRLFFIGVPKDTDDKEFVKELSDILNLGIDETNIKKTFRINTKNISADKSLPLNVEFHNECDKFKFLNQV